MEALLFLFFITATLCAVVYFMRKTSSATRAELSRKQKHIQKTPWQHEDKLVRSSSSRLADKDEVWRTRRQHVALASESANKTVGTRYFKYKDGEEPGYDGYSRSDRHHITPARIRKERRLEDIKVHSNEVWKPARPAQPQENH